MRISSSQRAIVLARLPRQIRRAVEEFRRLTGLRVSTTLGLPASRGRATRPFSPPVHPRCAERLRELQGNRPCLAEWRIHLRSTARRRESRIHLCPLGLLCAGVPIVVGDQPLGLAKLVSDPEISESCFRSRVRLLETLLRRPCLDLDVSILKEEVHALRASLSRLHQTRQPAWFAPGPAGSREQNPLSARALVGRVVDYLNQHYMERDLSLGQVAHAVGRNSKYVAHLFAWEIGERMRSYITTLRVRRSCELLLQTVGSTDQIALDAGFSGARQFRQAFRRVVGVTPSEYRQIFTPIA